MAYDARAVANEVLIRAWERGFEPTQLDIQKITYFLHGHHLLEHGAPLVETEFEALHYGPVQRSLLDCYRKFGDEPITELAMKFNPVKREYQAFPRILDNSVLSTIDRHIDFYLEYSSFELVEMTHMKGSPWSITMDRARNAVNIGMRISNDLIRTCFEGAKVA